MEDSAIEITQRERLILRHAQAIGEASSELLKVEKIAQEICSGLKQDLGYDFVSVQLVDVIEGTIQTVFGIRLGGEWYKVAKHSLDSGDDKFLDIQAHIALSRPPVIDIIKGWDNRFDKFIYDNYGHKDFVRAFVPLIVFRDPQGYITKAKPDQFRRGRVKEKRSVRDDPSSPREPREEGLTHSFRLMPEFSSGTSYEIMGTVEAGFDNSKRNPEERISIEEAETLFRHCCGYAYDLCQATLNHVFEIITTSAMEISGADISSLHYPLQFPLSRRRNRHTYEVWVGRPRAQAFRPRKRGLGARAIRTGEAQFRCAEQTDLSDGITFDPRLHAAGIKSLAAFPLIIDKGQQSPILRSTFSQNAGVLYVGRKDNHAFTDDEKDGLTLFANLAKDAIRHAIHYTQALHSARQLVNLHDMAIALARETDKKQLLRSIAGHTSNIMSADVVIIYEYDHVEEHFLDNPAVGGRCYTSLVGCAPPASLIKRRERKRKMIRTSSQEELMILLNTDDPGQIWQHFISDEGIIAGVAVPLWLGDEAVGAMFVAYRRTRDFPLREEKIIETLASTAAVAIRNQRLLTSRENSVRAMTHQLRNPLQTTTMRASELAERVRADSTCDAGEELSYRIDQIAMELEILDGLCQGVFEIFTREQTGGKYGERSPIDREVIDLHQEVLRLWDFLQSTKSKAAPDLELEILDGCSRQPTILMSRWIFRNVVHCLLDNAIKYGDSGSKVKVDWIESQRGESLLKVSSIGQPIRRTETERIFWQFGRARSAEHARIGGASAGLGLWIARGLMRSVGGEIRLELDPENARFSTFVVRIPDGRTLIGVETVTMATSVTGG